MDHEQNKLAILTPAPTLLHLDELSILEIEQGCSLLKILNLRIVSTLRLVERSISIFPF